MLGLNPQFLPDQDVIQVILPTHELIIFTKFHGYWAKIVNFFINDLFLLHAGQIFQILLISKAFYTISGAYSTAELFI